MSIKIVRWDGHKGRAFIECDGAPYYAKNDVDGFPVYTLPDTPGAQRLAANLCSINANKYRLIGCGPFFTRIQVPGGRFEWANVNPWTKTRKGDVMVWAEDVHRLPVEGAKPATANSDLADIVKSQGDTIRALQQQIADLTDAKERLAVIDGTDGEAGDKSVEDNLAKEDPVKADSKPAKVTLKGGK